MAKLILVLLVSLSAQAQESKGRQKEEDRLRARVEELEKTVKTLQDKVDKMEGTLMKGGGFMITANVTCEINTPFDGSYSATELSEAAAKAAVMEKCKEKAASKDQCGAFFVKCNK